MLPGTPCTDLQRNEAKKCVTDDISGVTSTTEFDSTPHAHHVFYQCEYYFNTETWKKKTNDSVLGKKKN